MVRFYLSLVATSIRASMALRRAFLFETGLMMANNLIFFLMWGLFFNEFKAIGEWGFKEMSLLLSIGLGSYGLVQIFLGGTRQIARIIINGDLDPFLTQPKNVLIHIAGSKSAAKGWGHLVSSMLFVLYSGPHDFQTYALILFSLCTGCIIYSSFRVIVHSIAFWLGPVETLSEKYADSLFIFANYPTNIYTNALQLLMFTLIPAGLISYLPVELIRHFSIVNMGILTLGAITFALLAFFVFYRGLKRYESGNHFGLRI